MGCLSTCPLSLDLAAEPASVSAARHAIAGYVGGKRVDEEAIALAVSEAVSNAILHAYRDERSGDERSGDERQRGRKPAKRRGRAEPGRIRLHARFTEHCLRVEVSDAGIGMRPRPDSPGLGLGLPLIAQLATHVDITSEHGTTVLMDFALGAAA